MRATRAPAPSARRISGYVGQGTVVKPSGVIRPTLCPRASSSRTVFFTVVTTPLTCGDQASVTIRIRMNLVLLGWWMLGEHVVPVQNRQVAFGRLDERRQALDPVTIIAVQDAADVANLGLVNMAADDAVEVPRPRLGGQRLLEGDDVADRVLHLVLEKLRQRPIAQAESRAHLVQAVVQVQ